MIARFNIEENKFVSKIIEQLSDLFFQFTVLPDNSVHFDYFSDAAFEFYELSSEQIMNYPKIILDQRLHQDDKKAFETSLNFSIQNLTRWEFEYRVNLPIQGLKWIRVSAKNQKLENGNIIFFGTKKDITDLKKEQEDYKISEARNQFANMASNVGVWDWNLVTNKVYYSPESLKILELENTEDIIDNPENWDDKVHPDDREAYFGNIKLHFEGKTPFYETYHRVLCNGNYKWILDRGKVILRNELGKPLRIVGTHTDVSLQKFKEQKLLETLELVNEQNNKLLNFAHIVSHNLKNHTGNLSTLLEMKASGMLDETEIFPYLNTVSSELTNSIDNLVAIVEVQNNNEIIKTKLNIDEYLSKVFNILLTDISINDIKVLNKVPKKTNIDFIPAYLESILLNLTTNAIKYANPNKKLVVKYFMESNDDYQVLVIKDNGLGIDLEKHGDNVFGLYKTFHNSKNAQGIGLYITKNQIEAMGGKIEVESQVNVGTTFKIFFK
jgi:PAS domain-containing protein